MLSRTTLSCFPPHSSLNSSPLNHLQPLACPEPRRVRRPKSQPLWNQANPASFSKTPRGGVGIPNAFYGTPGVSRHPAIPCLYLASPPCPLCSDLGALCVKPFLTFAGRQAQMVSLTPFRINTYEKPREGVRNT